jgi:cytochrome c oxidase subunit 2
VLNGVFGQPVKLQDGGTVVADETYLRESILSPAAKVTGGYQPIMPTYQGQVSEESLLSLIAYIESLPGSRAEPARPGPGAPGPDRAAEPVAGETTGSPPAPPAGWRKTP